MSWILLLKVPVVLATAFYAKSVLTPPQPPAHAHERERYSASVGKRLLEALGPLFLLTVRNIPVAVACADALFTLAHVYRATSLGATVLSTLCPNPDAAHPEISPVFVFATLMILLCAHARTRCYHELGKHFTYELSIRDDHKLVTTGPYAVVRHPSYTAAMLLVVGLTFWGAAPGSWLAEAGVLRTTAGRVLAAVWTAVLVFSAAAISRAPKEDAALRSAFGKEWDVYARRVRYMFIPWIL